VGAGAGGAMEGRAAGSGGRLVKPLVGAGAAAGGAMEGRAGGGWQCTRFGDGAG